MCGVKYFDTMEESTTKTAPEGMVGLPSHGADQRQSETTSTANYVLLSDLKDSVVKEVLAALTANKETRELVDRGSRKRSHSHQCDEEDFDDEMDDEDALSIDGEKYSSQSYLGEAAQDESNERSSDTLAKSDNMTDLFPANKNEKSTVAIQKINIAEEILDQVLDDSIDTQLGEKVLEVLAKRVVKHFQVDTKTISNDLLNRLKLPSNCAAIAVPMMNTEIKNLTSFESVRISERRLYNTQLHLQRATSAIANMVNMLLMADQEGKMADSKALTRIALDGITVLGQAQVSLSLARKQNIKSILADDVKDICSANRKQTQFLFGDDLAKAIKEAKDIHRMTNSLTNRKTTTSKRQAGRSFAANNQRGGKHTPFLGRGRAAARGKRNPQYRKQSQ